MSISRVRAVLAGAVARCVTKVKGDTPTGKIFAAVVPALDMIIAAVAEANDCTIVTDNEKDFTGLRFVNPMRR